MPNYAVMRTKKIKSVGSLKRALKHNRREQIPLNANPDMALKSRYFEYSKRDIDNYSEVFKKARKNAVYAVEWVFSASDMTDITKNNFNNWTKDNINFVAKKMGGVENILSCCVHADEKTPHLHIVAIPVKENKLNCKSYLGGSKYVMRDMQTEYCDIMKKYNLERGISKKETHRYNHKPSLYKANEALEKIENKLNTLNEECKKKIKRNNEIRQRLYDYGFTREQIQNLTERKKE